MTSLPQDAAPYADAVRAFADRPIVRVDTPGHQGQNPALAALIGEGTALLDVQPLLEGIDYGASPTPYEQSAALAAQAWGARRAWFLTNGASQGNVAACLALRGLGERIVVQRSVHSSVIDGLAFSGLDARFVLPSHDSELGVANGVTAASLDEALSACPDAVAAFIVTPSYFGAVADVESLARVAHSHGAALVVDEAWGSHFGFHPDLPMNAARLGADLVISSMHKLGGSLTQSALLQLGHGPFADALEPLVERAFRSTQSTSASALLIASLDLARRELAVNGQARISASLGCAAEIRAGLAPRFADIADRLLDFDDVVSIDPLRVGIDFRRGGISGHQARADLLERGEAHIEIATHATGVALIGAGSTPDVPRLLAALRALPQPGAASTAQLELPSAGARQMAVRDAYFARTEVVPAVAAAGRVSADSVAAYPPGIPNVLPGETLTRECIDFLQATLRQPSGHVRGGATTDMTAFRVVA